MLVVVYISIVYIMPTIWGISISCSVSLGPSGPGLGGCMSIGVYIDTVNIMPTVGGMHSAPFEVIPYTEEPFSHHCTMQLSIEIGEVQNFEK